jgi:hypothetical protein
MSCDADVRRFNDHLDCTVVYRYTGIMVHMYRGIQIGTTSSCRDIEKVRLAPRREGKMRLRPSFSMSVAYTFTRGKSTA